MKSREATRCVAALSLQAKNIYNGTMFIVRNVFSAFENGKIKEELHEHQQVAIQTVKEIIDRVNTMRIERNSKSPQIPQIDGPEGSPFSILDQTVINSIAMTVKDHAGNKVYANMPSGMARDVALNVRENFMTFFKAIKKFKAGVSDFTGRPKMPGYLPKKDRKTLELSLAPARKSAFFPKLTGRSIPIDYECEEYLNEEAKALFDQFKVDEAVEKIKKKTSLPENAELNRAYVTYKNGRAKINMVFKFEQEIDDDSLYAKFLENSDISQFGKEIIGPFGMLDLGCNNLSSLAFGNCHKEGMILTANRIERALQRFDEKIDARKSFLYTDELKELDKIPPKERNRQHHIRRKELLFILHQDEKLRALQHRKDRFSDNAIRQAASKIINGILAAGCSTLIIGHNKNWKDGTDMGTAMNRRFRNLSHTKLINHLQNACEANNIIFLTTEESYTSKHSFINNDPLPTRKEKQEEENTSSQKTTSVKDNTEEVNPTGTRNRHTYHNHEPHDKPAGWKQTIHADLNGAFNIARKVFNWFKFSEELNLSHQLFWLSPRHGFCIFSHAS